jgi:ATP-dependent Clp protease adapter protein ClpS
MPIHDYEHDEAVVTKSKSKLKKPPLYKVLLHNDDFTSMEFVVFILQSVFQRTDSDAVRIMFQVHTEGVGTSIHCSARPRKNRQQMLEVRCQLLVKAKN